jgi:hypothetical protein
MYFIRIQLIFPFNLVGVIALYTGLILWRLYIRLDSVKYPLKTYADMAERIFGKTARHICTFLQSLQLVVNVGFLFMSAFSTFFFLSYSGRHYCFKQWPSPLSNQQGSRT